MKLCEAFMHWSGTGKRRAGRIEADSSTTRNHPYRTRRMETAKTDQQAGDELWTFRSPQEEWDRHMGSGTCAGFETAVVYDVVTAQN